MKQLKMRIEAHEIDTLARKIVARAFPDQWEFRELTGRDYGIDMILEVFENNNPTGGMISLQIKGTKKCIDDGVNKIAFDVPVNTLRYSEMFLSPVLLVLCSVNDPNGTCYYIWLQEYIRVVLNYDNPKWRTNKSTVRVWLPVRNQVQEDIDKIRWISNYPKRNYEFCQLARMGVKLNECIYSYYKYGNMFDAENTYSADNEGEVNNLLKEILIYLKAIASLKSIFGEPNWASPQLLLNEDIIPAIEDIKTVFKGKKKKTIELTMKLVKLRYISNLVDVYNNPGYSRHLFEYNGDHDF